MKKSLSSVKELDKMHDWLKSHKIKKYAPVLEVTAKKKYLEIEVSCTVNKRGVSSVCRIMWQIWEDIPETIFIVTLDKLYNSIKFMEKDVLQRYSHCEVPGI